MNHTLVKSLIEESPVARDDFSLHCRRSNEELLVKESLKVIRSHVYAEVGPEKYLIYSYTHNTFAVFDIASEAKVIACCRLEGVAAETI